jgi:predicted ABC-type ATPase
LNSPREKRILIIAGPNGAGKTTFAREFLPNEADCPIFVNADLIAAGIAPFAPESAALRAGRLMLEEIDRHVAAGHSFAFETTLAGRTYAAKIQKWQHVGYVVELIFLKLNSANEARRRVALRVSQGGHNIADEVVTRTYGAGLNNFHTIYAPIVDAWVLYDNSEATLQLIDWREKK